MKVEKKLIQERNYPGIHFIELLIRYLHKEFRRKNKRNPIRKKKEKIYQIKRNS